MNTSRIARRLRAGWSYLQVVACLVSAAAGVWLGARYLGVHVEDLAYTALDESTVLEKLPEQWRPEPPPTLVRDAEQERRKAEQLTDELRQDLKQLEQEVASLRADTTVPLDEKTKTAKGNADEPTVAEATLAYWNQLRDISLVVGRLGAVSEQAIDEQNASRTLEVRGRLYRYGAKAVSALDTTDVDPHVRDFAQSLQNWYVHGAELNEKTLAVWQGEQNGKKGLGASAGLAPLQQQFDQESALIRDKSAGVRGQLVRRYGTDFPPLEL